MNDLECVSCGVVFSSEKYGGEECPACHSQDLYWWRQALTPESNYDTLDAACTLVYARMEEGDRLDDYEYQQLFEAITLAYLLQFGKKWEPDIS